MSFRTFFNYQTQVKSTNKFFLKFSIKNKQQINTNFIKLLLNIFNNCIIILFPKKPRKLKNKKKYERLRKLIKSINSDLHTPSGFQTPPLFWCIHRGQWCSRVPDRAIPPLPPLWSCYVPVRSKVKGQKITLHYPQSFFSSYEDFKQIFNERFSLIGLCLTRL